MVWLDGLTRAKAAARMENIRVDPKDKTSRIMTEAEFDAMVDEYVGRFVAVGGHLSAESVRHLHQKRAQIAALRDAAEQDRQSAANAQALKDKYDAAKKAKAAKVAAAKAKYQADRAAKRAESDKRRKKTILNQMVKTGGPIQGLGHMVDNYSGADLDSLIAISNTPIPREQGESDTDYRERWEAKQQYWKDAPIRDDRIDYISRRFYLGPVPVGQEREDLLKEFASLGKDPAPLREKVEGAERRKKESYERHERINRGYYAQIQEEWENPKPGQFAVKPRGNNVVYVFEPLGYPGKVIVKTFPDGAGRLVITGVAEGVNIGPFQNLSTDGASGKPKLVKPLTASEVSGFLQWLNAK